MNYGYWKKPFYSKFWKPYSKLYSKFPWSKWSI